MFVQAVVLDVGIVSFLVVPFCIRIVVAVMTGFVYFLLRAIRRARSGRVGLDRTLGVGWR